MGFVLVAVDLADGEPLVQEGIDKLHPKIVDEVIWEWGVVVIDGREEVLPKLEKLECQEVGSVGKVG